MWVWIKGLPVVAKLIGGIVAFIALLFVINFVHDLFFQAGEIEDRLQENQTDAAIESGSDAVDTVGDQGDAEDSIDKDVENTNDEIRNADSAADIDDILRDDERIRSEE